MSDIRIPIGNDHEPECIWYADDYRGDIHDGECDCGLHQELEETPLDTNINIPYNK